MSDYLKIKRAKSPKGAMLFYRYSPRTFGVGRLCQALGHVHHHKIDKKAVYEIDLADRGGADVRGGIDHLLKKEPRREDGEAHNTRPKKAEEAIPSADERRVDEEADAVHRPGEDSEIIVNIVHEGDCSLPCLGGKEYTADENEENVDRLT